MLSPHNLGFMNKSSKSLVGALAIAAGVFSGAELSEGEENESAASNGLATGTLTVKGGRASGNLTPGNQVSVSAEAAPAGAQFAGWTGDVAVLEDRFSSTTRAMVPFTAATVTATFNSVSELVQSGEVLPPTATPKGYSLKDIAKATAFFATRGPDRPNGRRKSNEPSVPFQILYDSNINKPHNTFLVGPDTIFYVPIFFVSDSPPIVGNFPSNVNDPEAVEKYLLDKQQLGGKKIEIRVDGKKTSIINDPTYFVGVKTPLADGGTHYITAAVFLSPLTKGTHTVTIAALFTGAAVAPPPFQFEISYTVIVRN